MIYLDSAAVVKLVHAEPESAALRSWLDEQAEVQWISSVLTEIESFRALARYAPEAVSRLPAVLDQIDLIDLDQRIRMLAQTVTPATVPRCHSPRHSLALPLFTYLVRDLRQAPARRGPGSGSAHRRARLTAIARRCDTRP
jgi:predicted nucleic acid-binding protein